MNNKLLDLILALNIQGIDISYTKTTSFNRTTKQLYYSHRLTIWEKKIVNHKAKHFPKFNKPYKRVSDMLIFLSKLVDGDVDQIIRSEVQ